MNPLPDNHPPRPDIVLVGPVRPDMRMAMLAHAITAGSALVVLPPHIKPPKDFLPELLKVAAIEPLALPPPSGAKQTKRQRTHPNEPFYNQFRRRRRKQR